MEAVINVEENTKYFCKISVFITIKMSPCSFSYDAERFEDISFRNTVAAI